MAVRPRGDFHPRLAQEPKRAFDRQNKPERSASPMRSIVAPDALPPSYGVPLALMTRAFYESHFGHDFSKVRVHVDRRAAQAAHAIAARAYTFGNDIVFGQGMYRPDTQWGRNILAHELAHVVQQRLMNTRARAIDTRADPDELQADRAARALAWGGLRPRYGAVASGTTWQASTPPPRVPTLLPARARIQRVQLTYDDGPDSAGNTLVVLNALKAASARATFYVVGKRVVQGDNWRIVFDIAAAGNWLGNHAYDWNDTTDNHVFLRGKPEERAAKILQTEWAIRDALVRGRDDARNAKTWETIPEANREYIEDVIAHGTGRFRTPGFRSHLWTSEGSATRAAIASVNQVLAATGLRPLSITEVTSWGLTHEGVTVDPEDWRAGRKQTDVESEVKEKSRTNVDSILLHSRIGASAAATPAILADIKSRNWSFDPTVQGAVGSVRPQAGFAGLSTISDPPTSAEIAKARAFLRTRMLGIGPVLSGRVAIGIFQLAQRAGSAEVTSFAAEIKSTSVRTASGPIPMANWLNASEQWRLFAGFFENWAASRPFPRVKGVTL